MPPRKPLPPALRGGGFTSAEGLAAGLGRKRMAGSDIQSPFRGVHVARSGNLTLADRCLALQRRLPPNTFFSGITAAVITGIPLPTSLERGRTVHISIPAPGHPPSGKNIVGHSVVVRPGDVRAWHGMRISAPERMWCELGSALTLLDLVAAGDYLVHHQLAHTSIDQLEDALTTYPGRRGLPRLRTALTLLSDRSESRQESRLRALLVLGGVEGLCPNYWIVTSSGHRYRADLAVPARKAILEYQSGYHESPEAFRADMTRIARLQADGWHVMQVNSADLDHPEELVARVLRWLNTFAH